MATSVQAYKTTPFSAVFQGYEGPAFAIRLWDGRFWSSSERDAPVCTFVLKSQKALASLIVSPNEVTLGEAFIHGGLDVEGDFFSAFSIAEHLFNRPRGFWQQMRKSWRARPSVCGNVSGLGRCTRCERDSSSISYHYDQPVEFFKPWLGRSLVYSCAYFQAALRSARCSTGTEARTDLHKAGAAAIRTLSRYRMRLGKPDSSRRRPSRRAGTWHYPEQGTGGDGPAPHSASWPRAIAARPNCATTASWKKPEQSFDKIASIGMVEHVGLKNLPLYFGIAKRLLRPGGLFLNHGIARSSVSPVRRLLYRPVCVS